MPPRNLGPEDVQRFANNFPHPIHYLSSSARTAQQAADAIGTSVAQIVKSLLFRRPETDSPLLILASGANRVDEAKVFLLLSEPIEKANADFVRLHTGYAIGGVPPFPHLSPLTTLIDEDLLGYDTIWAAAGHPNTVFPLTPQQLVALSNGRPADIKNG
jgi:prolyl-tRNA editing enzyme YbaK/EbsC (Cys-tRNA(Pro) deacylase)